MITWVAFGLYGLVLPPALTWLTGRSDPRLRRTGLLRTWRLAAFFAAVPMAALGVIAVIAVPCRACATGLVLSALIACVLLWWRKRRDRIKALAGARSLAVRAALVRTMRQSAKPRSVLRPGLEGGQ